jgi:hypothetical protein
MKKISGVAARNEKLEVHMPDPRGGTMVYTPTVLVAERDREMGGLAGQRAMYLTANIVS